MSTRDGWTSHIELLAHPPSFFFACRDLLSSCWTQVAILLFFVFFSQWIPSAFLLPVCRFRDHEATRYTQLLPDCGGIPVTLRFGLLSADADDEPAWNLASGLPMTSELS